MMAQMQWTNALSTHPSLETAVTEVTEAIEQSLVGDPHLGILFISSAYASDYPRLMPLLIEKLSLPILIGCGGSGIVGTDRERKILELEGIPALSLSVAHLPGTQIDAFHLSADELPDLDSPPEAWIDKIGIDPQKNPQFILLSDPFSAKINDLLEGLDFAYPSSVKIGGLASTGTLGVQNSLFYHHPPTSNQSLYRDGTVGLALSGNIILETIVAQGCRPIGKPYRVSQGDRNVILELIEIDSDDRAIGTSSSRPPLETLRDLMSTLSDKDRDLAQNSLFIGIVRDEFKLQLRQGDFLIRNLLGVDPRSGAIAIGDRVRPGQRIQFHLRDAHTSAEVQLLLEAHQHERQEMTAPIGALMFSCLGRGEGLYGQPNFDSTLFRRYFPNTSLGGFFCNGEIGPVGGRTFLHGYTSAFAILRQP